LEAVDQPKRALEPHFARIEASKKTEMGIRESLNQEIAKQKPDAPLSKKVTRSNKDENALHDLVLGQTGWLLAFHHFFRTRASVHVLHECDAQRTTSVLVAGEFGCGKDISRWI
jgi:hypothetical protein